MQNSSIEICTNCNGAGLTVVATQKTVCQTCQGSGRILVTRQPFNPSMLIGPGPADDKSGPAGKEKKAPAKKAGKKNVAKKPTK